MSQSSIRPGQFSNRSGNWWIAISASGVSQSSIRPGQFSNYGVVFADLSITDVSIQYSPWTIFQQTAQNRSRRGVLFVSIQYSPWTIFQLYTSSLPGRIVLILSQSSIRPGQFSNIITRPDTADLMSSLNPVFALDNFPTPKKEILLM